MKWTKERPSKSGYYWLRWAEDPSPGIVVEVYRDQGNKIWCRSMFGLPDVGKMDGDKYLWSDEPIQEPQE